MNYLVTGGAGFIGSNLTKRLVVDGHRVHVLDNLSTGHKGNVPEGIQQLVVGEVRDRISEFQNKVIKLDGVFHLGIPSSTPLYDADPSLYHLSLENLQILLEHARRYNIRVVMASTSNIYNGYATPWHEASSPIVNTIYTETRYAMERMLELYSEQFDIPCVALRLFSVYGPGEEHKGNLANIITQMLWAKKDAHKFVVFGDGNQTRDSVYVDDVVEAFIMAMNKMPKECIVVNVGTGFKKTFNELAQLIGVELEYVPHIDEYNYVYDQQAYTEWSRRFLGFVAKVSVEDGIKRLKEYYGIT